MNPLLRKDFRLNRMVLVIAATPSVVPYVIAIIFAVNESYADSMPLQRSWAHLLLTANHFCLMQWPVAAALLGGNAFACERADRSAEFLAYLPPTKMRIATSKFTVVLVVAGIYWSVNLFLFWLGSSYIGDDSFQYLDLSDAMPKSSFAAIGLLTFGCGWLASSMVNNTGPAVVLGLGAPVVLFAGFQFTSWLVGWPADGQFGKWFTTTGLSLGMIACGAGWHLYLRRVEP